jgi:hypothetical protein
VRLAWCPGPSAGADVYEPPAGRYLAGEPAVLADPDDRSEASVLCHEFDPRVSASWFVIHEAYELGRGHRARLRIDFLVPPGFHSTFIEAGGPGRARGGGRA